MCCFITLCNIYLLCCFKSKTKMIVRLTKTVIDRIKDSRSLPKKIAVTLDVSRITMWRYIKDNDDILTKAAVLKLIKEETGLTEHEILEPEKATA